MSSIRFNGLIPQKATKTLKAEFSGSLYWLQGAPPALRQIASVDLIGLPALGYVIWRAFWPA